MTDAQLALLRRAEDDNEARLVQLFVAGWLAAVANGNLPLTPPFQVTLMSDQHGNYLPHFALTTRSGLEFDVRVLPAATATDLAQTWRDGLHSLTRSSCPGCDAELTRVALQGLAYTFEVCTCGSPDYDHLVEQLWHRTCLMQAPMPTVAEETR